MVLDHRVHIISQGRSVKRIFPVTDTASVNISDLSDDAEYFLTIDARTQAGYNDSLHLWTVYIPVSADGWFFEDLLCVDLKHTAGFPRLLESPGFFSLRLQDLESPGKSL